jgi:hypothetical protein
MADRGAGRIGEQHDAYRRGLVLGLTMAEVGILIIFVLMLLIAFEEYRQTASKRALQGTTAVADSELAELRLSKELLQRLTKALGVTDELPPEDFQKLVRAIQPILKSGVGQQALAEARAEIDRQRAVREGLVDALTVSQSGNADEVVRRLEEQTYKLASQEGQLNAYEKQLQEAGLGKGARVCWRQADGTIDYLYDVVLTTSGIRMRDYRYSVFFFFFYFFRHGPIFYVLI